MEQFDIAICGYGPVGSTFAGLMGKLGHKVLVIEKNTGPSPTARAINTDGEQLRTFDRLGIADKVVENSTEIHCVHFGDANLNPIQTIEQPVGVSAMGWPNQVLFYQPELEGFIRASVQSENNIVIKEGTELLNFDDSDEGVHLNCKNSDGELTFFSKYLIGCDGASSFVRRELDVDLEDFEYNQEWLVCDAHLTKKINIPEKEAMQVCDPKRPGTYVPGRRGHLRFEFKKMPGENSKELEKEETVWKLLKPWINENNAKLERAQVYSFHACIAETWRKGNVLIAGDAAHQMPPFMGAGMGTGIRDITNISWKLDLLLKNKANEGILDTYQKERHSHAKWTIAQTVTIGQVIEGFCAAAEGKEYEPKGPSYDVNFPHIPAGIYSDPTDMVTGVPIPQPILSKNNKKEMLDRIINGNFAVLTREANLDLSDKAKSIIDLLGIKLVTIEPDEDTEERLKTVFEKYKAVLVRPDKYTYGGVEDISSLSEMIESLEKEFSLNI